MADEKVKVALAWVIFVLLIFDAITTMIAVSGGAVESNKVVEAFVSSNTLLLLKVLNGFALIYLLGHTKLSRKDEKLVVNFSVVVAVFYFWVVVNNLCVIFSL